MNVLQFVNDGPLLVASDYWQSETAAAGKLYVFPSTPAASACSSQKASTDLFPAHPLRICLSPFGFRQNTGRQYIDLALQNVHHLLHISYRISLRLQRVRNGFL